VKERLAEVLLRIEEQIALLRRCQPVQAAREVERLILEVEAGREPRLEFSYSPPPCLDPARRALEAIGSLDTPWSTEYRARAEELELEAELVLAVGTCRFRELAARRFPTPDPALNPLVEHWLELPREDQQPVLRSDDRSHPKSLIRVMERSIGELELAVRVVVSELLLATAAVGRDTVFLRPSVWLEAGEAERIAVHEVRGHLQPRVRSRAASDPILRAGCAGSDEDQEGYALFLEARAGLLSSARRRALAVRHLSAGLVRAGADFVTASRALLKRGCSPREAVPALMRAMRGGGLCRELVYLPRYLALSARFVHEPALVRWFESGRVSLRYALAHGS